jgi:hypothetical protein
LEAERQRLTQESHRRIEPLSPALSAFMTQRNLLREKVSDILPHRAWTENDVGEAIYQGRRNLTDGSQVALFQKGHEMLVKPIQSKEYHGLTVGQTIHLNNRGQPQTKGQGYER